MRAIETAILKGSVELAICKRSPLSPQLVYEPYISFPIVFFVAKNHPLAKTSPTFSTLAKYPFIIYERVENGATTRTLMSVLGKTGYVPNVSMRCESPRIVRHAVKEQLGIGLMYYDLIESEAQNGIFKILEVPALSIERGSFVVYQKAKPLSDCGQNFLQLLREDRDRFRLN
jgi:DNA-binding transcriptional LysR family regulator